MSDISTHQAEAHKLGKQVTDKLNTVVLGVEAFRVDHGIYRPLCPMAFSNPINNLKNPSTGELKICRISAFAGSVEGEEEVIILIERVKKGDIHVRFFEHQHQQLSPMPSLIVIGHISNLILMMERKVRINVTNRPTDAEGAHFS